MIYYKATTLKKTSWYKKDLSYKEGKVYEEEGEIELCSKGFHFTQEPLQVLNYYSWPLLLWEVTPLGVIKGNPKDKLVTNKLLMAKILSLEETKRLLTGLSKEYYKDGTLSWERNYKEGKLEGSYKRYYKDGTLYWEGNYKEGKLEGLSKGYYEDGTLSWERNYKEGKLV